MTTRKLPANALAHTHEIYYRVWFVQLQPGYEFGDVFDPGFWAHHARKVRATDLIRIRAHDASFDFFVSVDSVSIGGVVVNIWPRYQGGVDAKAAIEAQKVAAEARPKKVPFRADGKPTVHVEHLPATKWRVLAIDGSTASEGHETEAEAMAARDKYLKALGMELPSDEEIAAAAEKVAKDAAARKKTGKAA